ncbi:MAG: sugar transporter [Sphingomonas bacterium]|nr:sugar transporter [Sphingomonas bacterium]MDB5717287.1 sugar transporter [Sphingomonas bacterium]
MIGPGTSANAIRRAGGSAPAALLILVIALFFIWGGITSLNDILIPKLKGLFQLSYTQAMLTQFAFFMAYALVSLPAGWLIARLGYGKGIVLGLSVMAGGCLLFVPAASTATYPLFLVALFVLAAGITILQVAANPLIANLGPAESSHSRLTFAQAFNALGTTIWPFVGAQIILGSIATVDPETLSGAALVEFQAREAAVIGNTYIAIALVLLAIAALFWLLRARVGEAEPSASLAGSLKLLRRRRLGFGVAAIFFYVGAEVSIGSIMVSYLLERSTLALDEQAAGQLVALYWGGAMIGRFIGALLLRVVSPGKLLACAAIGACGLTLLSVASTGSVAGYTLIAVGLMNSIMFPTIFSLALEGLGEKTPQGSGLLCMAIVGGAIIPLIAGAVADTGTLAAALLVPAGCYLIVATYGWGSRRPAAA